MSTIQQAPAPAPDQPRPRVSRGLLLAVLSSFAVAVAIVVTILVLQRSDHRNATVTTPDPTTQPAQTDEQRITAAYQGYWDAVHAANNPPDPSSPLLGSYMVDPQLTAVRNAIAKKAQAGVSIRIPQQSVAAYRVQSVAISGDTAVVSACNVDDTFFVDAAGDVVDGAGRPAQAGVGTDAVTAEMVRTPSSWVVRTIKFGEHWEGVAGCATEQ